LRSAKVRLSRALRTKNLVLMGCRDPHDRP
jgi:hypothetical protein